MHGIHVIGEYLKLNVLIPEKNRLGEIEIAALLYLYSWHEEEG